MKDWLLANALSSEDELKQIEEVAKQQVKDSRHSAWEKYIAPEKQMLDEAVQQIQSSSTGIEQIQNIISALRALTEPLRRDILKALATCVHLHEINGTIQPQLIHYYQNLRAQIFLKKNTHCADIALIICFLLKIY